MDKIDKLNKESLLALEEYMLQELTESIIQPSPSNSGDFLMGQNYFAKIILIRVRERIKQF